MSITVNGEKIPDKAVEEEYNRMKPDYDHYVTNNGKAPDEAQLREWSEENLIERAVLRQEAMKAGDKIPPEMLEEIYEDSKSSFGKTKKKDALQFIEHQLRIERLVQKLQDAVPEPTEQELKEYYTNNMEAFKSSERIGARHIIKHVTHGQDKTKAYVEILNIKEQLNKGRPFEKLAEEHSDCSDNGGDLGYFERGQMVQEFEDVAFSMKPGEVSDVFLTGFGYHIVKVYDKKEPGYIPFQEVKSVLSEHLHKEKKGQALEEYLDKLKAEADIKR